MLKDIWIYLILSTAKDSWPSGPFSTSSQSWTISCMFFSATASALTSTLSLVVDFSLSLYAFILMQIILNKVLLVGTKTTTYIGKPVVTNAAVHAVVEEQVILFLLQLWYMSSYISNPSTHVSFYDILFYKQGLNPKVIVFKYKKKKNYRRNIGHRQVKDLSEMNRASDAALETFCRHRCFAFHPIFPFSLILNQ